MMKVELPQGQMIAVAVCAAAVFALLLCCLVWRRCCSRRPVQASSRHTPARCSVTPRDLVDIVEAMCSDVSQSSSSENGPRPAAKSGTTVPVLHEDWKGSYTIESEDGSETTVPCEGTLWTSTSGAGPPILFAIEINGADDFGRFCGRRDCCGWDEHRRRVVYSFQFVYVTRRGRKGTMVFIGSSALTQPQVMEGKWAKNRCPHGDDFDGTFRFCFLRFRFVPLESKKPPRKGFFFRRAKQETTRAWTRKCKKYRTRCRCFQTMLSPRMRPLAWRTWKRWKKQRVRLSGKHRALTGQPCQQCRLSTICRIM
eukprot:NODE_3335_length_996_cov_24.174234_g3067_i0.p1 GENE.NODE_3335_length_996_cov_24.174234_g3067_i0~~NODE_3335_length_996_cov_24.174234_g3067_i0.p1  ORF type:complete len:331 (+),score=45.96 NODE_3335_length_996_cov_24.174234_g3067_i0:61-993(+)